MPSSLRPGAAGVSRRLRGSCTPHPPTDGRIEPFPSLEASLELLDLCESLKRQAEPLAERIVTRWRELATSEPWLSLPENLDFDHLPDLIRSLASSALCTDFDRSLCSRLANIAARHGEHRAEQGFGDDLIHREYHLLRRGLWDRLRAQYGETSALHYASMRLDTVSSLASAAALHGIHREELDRSGRWPQVLDELLEQWPLPRA